MALKKTAREKLAPAKKAVARRQTESTGVEVVPRPKASPFVRMFVADEFQNLVGGKIIVIGLYADNVIVSKVAKGVADPTKDLPHGIERLSFLFSIGGISGTHDLSASIGDAPLKSWSIDIRRGGSANVIFVLRPMLIRTYGVKPVRVEFAGVTWDFAFEVRRADADDQRPRAPRRIQRRIEPPLPPA